MGYSCLLQPSPSVSQSADTHSHRATACNVQPTSNPAPAATHYVQHTKHCCTPVLHSTKCGTPHHKHATTYNFLHIWHELCAELWSNRTLPMSNTDKHQHSHSSPTHQGPTHGHASRSMDMKDNNPMAAPQRGWLCPQMARPGVTTNQRPQNRPNTNTTTIEPHTAHIIIERASHVSCHSC